MIELVFIARLANFPDRCREVEVMTNAPHTFACMMVAPMILAEWEGKQPWRYEIKSAKCYLAGMGA